MNFSEKLKDIRKSEGLSQEQLAEKIGVSRQAITKWETGKGLPDIENMVILAEIFKTTLDELILDTSQKPEPQKPVYESETVYDIDCEKHFDMAIGSVGAMLLTSGTDEKLHVKLLSETLSDLSSLFKIRLDEKKNKLDVNCLNKSKLSRYASEEALQVEITLPKKYTDHCEVDASVKSLKIQDLHLNRLEYDGDAESVEIIESSGSLEFTGKTDYDIQVDRITGHLDVNQWKARSRVLVKDIQNLKVLNKGRRCQVFCSPELLTAESANELSISGIFSEMTVETS